MWVHRQVRAFTKAGEYTLVKASAAYRTIFAHLAEQSNLTFQVRSSVPPIKGRQQSQDLCKAPPPGRPVHS